MPALRRGVAAAVALPLAYSLWEPWRLVVRHFDVDFPDLPTAVDGLRMAQISDLHCSAITPASIAARAVALCNAETPDVVVLTGDYISRRNSYAQATLARVWAAPIDAYATAVARELAVLHAPDGVFAVVGNHDYTEGHIGMWHDLLTEVGIAVLVNRVTKLRGVLPLVGLDDLRAGRPLWRQTLEPLDAAQPHVILSHNPRLILSASNRNCLMLAGHTHGGQVHLPFTNFRRKPRDTRSTAWLRGWYQWGLARLYVSTGAGSVHFPMRFNCPPEISIFTLRRRERGKEVQSGSF